MYPVASRALRFFSSACKKRGCRSDKSGRRRAREDARGRAWDGGALVPGVEYVQQAPLAPSAEPGLLYRVRHPFMRGAVVERIQKALRKRGFHPGAVDAVYGPLTEASVFNFQAFKGLAADGMVGPETADALGVDL